jgi:hypothetical protein
VYLAKVVAVELAPLVQTHLEVAADLAELLAAAGAILVELELVFAQVALLQAIHGAAILAVTTHIQTITASHLILLAAEQLDPMATLVLVP